LRNAFLNAPWVKAVIPIRPGRERDALEWLKQSEVEGTEGLQERYAGADEELFLDKYATIHGTQVTELTIDEVLALVADDVAETRTRPTALYDFVLFRKRGAPGAGRS